MEYYTFENWKNLDDVYPPHAHYDLNDSPSSYVESLHLVMMDTKALNVLIKRGYLPEAELLRIRGAQKNVWDGYKVQILNNIQSTFNNDYDNVPETDKVDWLELTIRKISADLSAFKKRNPKICADFMAGKDYSHLIDPHLYKAFVHSCNSAKPLLPIKDVNYPDYTNDPVGERYFNMVHDHRNIITAALTYFWYREKEKIHRLKLNERTAGFLTKEVIYNKYWDLRLGSRKLGVKNAFQEVKDWLNVDLGITDRQVKVRFDITLEVDAFSRSANNNIPIKKTIVQ